MAVPRTGGCKPLFTRAIDNHVLDCKALLVLAKNERALARNRKLDAAARLAHALEAERLLAQLGDRLDLLRRVIESHQRAMGDQPAPLLCRLYEVVDPPARAETIADDALPLAS